VHVDARSHSPGPTSQWTAREQACIVPGAVSPPAVSVSFTGDGRTVVAVGERRRSFTTEEIEALVTRSGPEGVIAEVRAQGRKGPSLEGPTCPFVIGDYTVTGQLGEGSFGRGAARRIILLTDSLTRESLTPARLRGALVTTGALVHVGIPSLSFRSELLTG